MDVVALGRKKSKSLDENWADVTLNRPKPTAETKTEMYKGGAAPAGAACTAARQGVGSDRCSQLAGLLLLAAHQPVARLVQQGVHLCKGAGK